MNERIRAALQTGGTIDVTTTGRRSAQRRRIEIAFFTVEGDLYITGQPGRPRGWMANLRAEPAFTFHLKQGVQADLPATATPIFDEETRRRVLSAIVERLRGRGRPDLGAEPWISGSPLVRVTLAEPT